MAPITRREFFKKTATDVAVAGFLAANVAALRANPLGLPIGSQTYPHRARIQSGEFAGLLKDMKSAGIDVIELCSPSYKEFASLADGKAARKVVDDCGMKCLSAHFGMNVLRSNQPEMIQWAHDLGMTQMSTASLGGKVVNGVTSLDEVKRAADEYNKIGAAAKKAGLQQVLHNEGFEVSKLEDGRLTYPVLLEYLDPDLVKMQFQMSSMRTVGDPVMYFTHHPGRFISAHLQSVNLDAPTPPARGMVLPAKPKPGEEPAGRGGAGGGGGRGGGAPQLAIGEDSIDWVKVFTAAKASGLKNYFIEMSWDATVKSAAYLKTLEV